MMDTTPNPDSNPGARRTPAEEHAWWTHLDDWVTHLRHSHEHLWPPPATSVAHKEPGRLRQYPWPECWRRHPGLVALLDALRVWHTVLVSQPLTDETARAFVDWHTIVEQMLAQEVQAIAKYCPRGRHRGPDVGPRPSRAHLAGKAYGPWSDPPDHREPLQAPAQHEHRHHKETRRNPADHPSSEGLT